MPELTKKYLRVWIYPAILVGLFLAGLWLVVIRPLGPNLALIPGDLGDVRFNNFVLEHFFRWVNGLEKSYWSPAIFYPFPNALAFSDNLLGSAPFYSLFRWAGLDRETAYQAWYILGFGLNYTAAVYVLSRFKINTLAVAAGAYYFSFGLPVLAQENHPQLLYRCAIPLACFFLWKFANAPRLRWLIALAGMAVWQFYLGIYTGVFLILLLVLMVLLIPFCLQGLPVLDRLKFWPQKLKQGWSGAVVSRRVLSLIGLAGLGACLWMLFQPYYQVSRTYGFTRGWDEASSMLPRWRSYFLADSSIVWQPISSTITGIPVRHEHQLFPGIAAFISLLLMLWALWRLGPDTRGFILAHLGALALLIIITLNLHGISIYRLLWQLPGLNSIRAVSRIILVMMWPLAVVVACAIDTILRSSPKMAPILVPVALLLTGLMIFETARYDHVLFGKAETQTRVAELRKEIPAQVPPNPVLMVASRPGQPWWSTEIDAMLLGQDLGWPVFNGYSGNRPASYGPTASCAELPKRVLAYLKFSKENNSSEYFHLIERAVPLGFTDCDPAWWQNAP